VAWTRTSRTSSHSPAVTGTVQPLWVDGRVVGPSPQINFLECMSGVPCDLLRRCPRTGRREQVRRTELDLLVGFCRDERLKTRRAIREAAEATGAMWIRSWKAAALPALWLPESLGLTVDDLDSDAESAAWIHARRELAAVDGQTVGALVVKDTSSELHLWVFAEFLRSHVEIDLEPAVPFKPLLLRRLEEVLNLM
jgi:hypothetical protein